MCHIAPIAGRAENSTITKTVLNPTGGRPWFPITWKSIPGQCSACPVSRYPTISSDPTIGRYRLNPSAYFISG